MYIYNEWQLSNYQQDPLTHNKPNASNSGSPRLSTLQIAQSIDIKKYGYYYNPNSIFLFT